MQARLLTLDTPTGFDVSLCVHQETIATIIPVEVPSPIRRSAVPDPSLKVYNIRALIIRIGFFGPVYYL